VSVERLEESPPCGDSNQYAIKQKVSVPAPNEVSVERLERSTNGLKGRLGKKPSPIQCTAVFA